MTSYTTGPTRLYAWDVQIGDRGEAGVTDDRSRAISNVHEALRTAETKARGKVRKVGISSAESGKYVELGDVAEAWRDEASGAVVWRADR